MKNYKLILGLLVGLVLAAGGTAWAGVSEFDLANREHRATPLAKAVTPVDAAGAALGTAGNPVRTSPATSPATQPVFPTASVTGASLTTPTKASNCAANGTTTLSLSAGTYDFTGSDEVVFFCGTDDGGSGTDCATLGSSFHPGVTRRYTVPAITGYCRSAGATGDLSALLVTAP